MSSLESSSPSTGPGQLRNEQEYDAAHHYTQRILEDFYDHRAEVEAILKAEGRIPST